MSVDAAEKLKARVAEAKAKKLAREKLIAERAADFKALPDEERARIDGLCIALRTAFGDSAEWTVYDNEMPTWEELPEANRQNWRVVARLLGN